MIWAHLCLSHCVWCEMTALSDISGMSPWVSTYIPPVPRAGSFSSATHWTLFWSMCFYMFELHPGYVWVQLLRHTTGIQVLCFTPFLTHGAGNSAVAHAKAVFHTMSFPSTFGRNTWIWAKVWDVLQNCLQKGHSLFAGKAVPLVIQIQTDNRVETPPSSIFNTTKALQGSPEISVTSAVSGILPEILPFQAYCSWILCLACSNATFKRFPLMKKYGPLCSLNLTMSTMSWIIFPHLPSFNWWFLLFSATDFHSLNLPWQPAGRTGFDLLWSVFLAYSLLHIDRASPHFFPGSLHTTDHQGASLSVIFRFCFLFFFFVVCVCEINLQSL